MYLYRYIYTDIYRLTPPSAFLLSGALQRMANIYIYMYIYIYIYICIYIYIFIYLCVSLCISIDRYIQTYPALRLSSIRSVAKNAQPVSVECLDGADRDSGACNSA